jgi:hypothetical protein
MMKDPWPLLMDLPTASRFTSHTRAQFRAMITAGLFPPGRSVLSGKEPWHRGELEKAADRLWQLEKQAQDEQQKASAQRALEAVDSAIIRRGKRGRQQSDRPALPPHRAEDSSSAA